MSEKTIGEIVDAPGAKWPRTKLYFRITLPIWAIAVGMSLIFHFTDPSVVVPILLFGTLGYVILYPLFLCVRGDLRARRSTPNQENQPLKAKQFIRDRVLPSGGKLVKKDGDHRVFEFPNGRRMVVPTGGKHSEAKPYLETRLKNILRGTGS